jgi:hypothetical protein
MRLNGSVNGGLQEFKQRRVKEMSVLRQRTSQRTKKLLTAGGIGAAIMGVISSGLIIMTYNQMNEKQKEMEQYYLQMVEEQRQLLEQEQANRQKVYVVNRDLPAGTMVTEADLVAVDIPEAGVPENAVSDEKFPVGKYTKIEIKQNTPLTTAMFYEEGITPNDARYQEFDVIFLPSDLKKDQVIDVRIKFPTGHDFIVLAKKKVKNLVDSTVFLEMDEKEILMMSSAIVDAYLNNGMIYALTYVDPTVQEKPAVTYPPSQEVRDLIMRDPNILAAAKRGLEERMRATLEADLSEIDENGKKKVGGVIQEPKYNQPSGWKASVQKPNQPSQGNNGSSNSTSGNSSGSGSTPPKPSGSNSTSRTKDSQKSIFDQNTDDVITP